MLLQPLLQGAVVCALSKNVRLCDSPDPVIFGISLNQSPLTNASVAVCGSATTEKRLMLGTSVGGMCSASLLDPLRGSVHVVTRPAIPSAAARHPPTGKKLFRLDDSPSLRLRLLPRFAG